MICTQILSFFQISLRIERQYGTQHDGDSIMWPHLSDCLSLEIRSLFCQGGDAGSSWPSSAPWEKKGIGYHYHCPLPLIRNGQEWHELSYCKMHFFLTDFIFCPSRQAVRCSAVSSDGSCCTSILFIFLWFLFWRVHIRDQLTLSQEKLYKVYFVVVKQKEGEGERQHFVPQQNILNSCVCCYDC